MESPSINNRLITAGSILLGGLLMTKACEPEKPAPVEKETRHIQTRARTVVEAPHEPTPPEPTPEVEPFTVDLRGLYKEDGSPDPNFNFVYAVRDCIEATGDFACVSHPGRDSCYILKEDGPYLHISIGYIPSYYEEKGVRLSFNIEEDEEVYNVDPKNKPETQNIMDGACNRAIEEGSTKKPQVLQDEGLLTMALYATQGAKLVESSDELFSELEFNGFKPQEKDARNNFVVEIGGKETTITPIPLYAREDRDELLQRGGFDYERFEEAIKVQFKVSTPQGMSYYETLEEAMDAVESGTPSEILVEQAY